MTSDRKPRIWVRASGSNEDRTATHFGNDGNEVLRRRERLGEFAAQKIENGVSIEDPFQDHSLRTLAW